MPAAAAKGGAMMMTAGEAAYHVWHAAARPGPIPVAPATAWAQQPPQMQALWERIAAAAIDVWIATPLPEPEEAR
jgi:hypothetical protein